MKGKITFKDILSTLHSDLIGKDSHRGITLTYGWMANQVGHFALGFIPVTILYSFDFGLREGFISVSLFWLAFEIYNALSPLYKKEYRGNGKFKVQWKNLTSDTFTDLCFFWLGSSTMYFIQGGDKSFLWAYFLLLLLLIVFTCFWFLTKFYQQNAYLPYPFRLSQWNNPISDESRDHIMSYWKQPDTVRHFIVIGNKGSGKTRLMVGVANEMAIRHRLSTYTTFTKFISQLQEPNEELNRNSYSKWNWTESDFIIVDDINPVEPISANLVKASDVINFIDLQLSERNRKCLMNTSFAWVVGEYNQDDSSESWVKALKDLGISENCIHLVNLNA